MNEYENALFSALMVLASAAAQDDALRSSLPARLREVAGEAHRDGRSSGAATLEMIASAAEGGQFFIPKPPFGIIDGGKKD